VRVAIGHGGLRGRVMLRRKSIRRRITAWIDVMGFRRAPAWGRRLVLPLRWPAADLVQPRAIPRWVGPGGVMPVKRTNAVMLTAMAPITEKTICQVRDGTAIWAIPCVAL
jgi:hypothetical protein